MHEVRARQIVEPLEVQNENVWQRPQVELLERPDVLLATAAVPHVRLVQLLPHEELLEAFPQRDTLPFLTTVAIILGVGRVIHDPRADRLLVKISWIVVDDPNDPLFPILLLHERLVAVLYRLMIPRVAVHVAPCVNQAENRVRPFLARLLALGFRKLRERRLHDPLVDLPRFLVEVGIRRIGGKEDAPGGVNYFVAFAVVAGLRDHRQEVDELILAVAFVAALAYPRALQAILVLLPAEDLQPPVVLPLLLFHPVCCRAAHLVGSGVRQVHALRRLVILLTFGRACLRVDGRLRELVHEDVIAVPYFRQRMLVAEVLQHLVIPSGRHNQTLLVHSCLLGDPPFDVAEACICLHVDGHAVRVLAERGWHHHQVHSTRVVDRQREAEAQERVEGNRVVPALAARQVGPQQAVAVVHHH
eukprot:scaffold609_cov234-Pinguiococcus_pyrenoidosus.AAC.17